MADSETAPLLSEQYSGEVERSSHEPGDATKDSRDNWHWIYIVLILILLAFVADVGETLFVAPRIRFVESIACLRYYSVHDPSVIDDNGLVPEEFCKIDDVQRKTTSVLGGQVFFDNIPSVLLLIPYSILADSRGRKWMLVLAIGGSILYLCSFLFLAGLTELPLQFSWLSALCFIIGGGPPVATTWITTMVADVVPPHLRSTVFFYRFCCDQVADLIVPPIAAALMAKGIWPPLVCVVVLQGITLFLALILPETMPKRDRMVCDAADENSTREQPQDPATRPRKQPSFLRGAWRSYIVVMQDSTVMSLVFMFLVSKAGRQANTVLLQYVSVLLGWDLSQAGLLMSLRASINIILFTIILPAVTNLLWSKSTAIKDLLIAKVSILLLAAGSFILCVAGTSVAIIIGVIVSTLGAGFTPVLRSVTTSIVELQQTSQTSTIGRLYALIGIMEGLGNLAGGPSMAWAFVTGMGWGSAWLGLPFALATLLFVIVSLVLIRYTA